MNKQKRFAACFCDCNACHSDRSCDLSGRSGGIYSKNHAQRLGGIVKRIYLGGIVKRSLAMVSSLTFLMLMFLPACTLYRPVAAETGHYYINPDADFAGIGKTVVFEFDNLSTRPQISTDLTQAVTEAIQKRHLFSISVLHRAEPAWRSLDLDDTSSYSLQELSTIRRLLKADAILFGRITQYYPYPHMLVAMHLKMIDLRNGKLLWATEQIWDSTDKRVERRMRVFFNSRMRAGYQPLDWELLVTSPLAFNKFVACEVAQTLPGTRRYVSVGESENLGRQARIGTMSKKILQIPQKILKFSSELTRIETQVPLLSEHGN